MFKITHRLFLILLIAILSGWSSTSSNTKESAAALGGAPKNIIMVVADGMGPNYTTGYRYYADDPKTSQIESTILDSILVGAASTYPASISGLVTDSAAGATALSAGVKTYNGAIGLDVDKQKLNTVLREAKRLGMRTGLAVTSQIVHATPASYVTHNESRRNYNEIADSFFDDRINGEFVADIMLGGGTSYFVRDDRDIVSEFVKAGYDYADQYDALANIEKSEKLLGLFAPVGLPWVLDDVRPDRLRFLTQQAIKHLENDKGYFLLVEASQVDWAGHGNDVGSAMAEMEDLAKTMEFLYQYVEDNPDTLVVLTADHSTGGISLAANGEYRWSPKWLRGMQGSVYNIAYGLADQSDSVEYVSQRIGFELNDEEQEQVIALSKNEDMMGRADALKQLLDTRTNTGWTTSGHVAVDVPVYAFGQGKHLFAGHQDNTEIAKKLFKLLENHQ